MLSGGYFSAKRRCTSRAVERRGIISGRAPLEPVAGFHVLVSGGGILDMAVAEIQQHRWTREEYERMSEAGFFHPEARVELIEGIVYDMAPQGSFHSTGVSLTAQALQSAFPSGCYVRVQMP